MAGFFEIEGLEARKRALVTESEVYRQTLMLELQQLRLQTGAVRRRLTTFSSPLLFLAPLIGPLVTRVRHRVLFGKQPFGWRRVLLGAWTAWRLYRQFGPVVRGVLAARPFGRPTESTPLPK